MIEHVEKIDKSPAKQKVTINQPLPAKRKMPTADDKSKPPTPKRMRTTKKRTNLIESDQKVEDLRFLYMYHQN